MSNLNLCIGPKEHIVFMGLTPEFDHGSSKHIEKSIECYEPSDRSVTRLAFNNCAREGKSYDFDSFL